jgi:hypothetical protein
MSIGVASSGTAGGFVSAGAFNTSPAASGTFIPEIWSGKLNVKFYATTVFGEVANTDYEGDIKNIGDTVLINNIPDITISDYTIGQSLTYQVPVPSTTTLSISKAKYFGVAVNDVIEYQSQPRLMDMFTNDAAKQLAKAIDTDLWKNSVGTADTTNRGVAAGAISSSYNLGGAGASAAADTGSPLTLSSSNIISVLTQMASCLDENLVPDEDRWLVISPAVRNLLMNSNLQQAYLTGDDKSVLRNGKIGVLDRFTIYVSALLPVASGGHNFDGTTNASAVARKCMIAGHKSAITFASQIAKVESLPNPGDFGSLVRGLNVYGYTTLKATGLVLAQYA